MKRLYFNRFFVCGVDRTFSAYPNSLGGVRFRSIRRNGFTLIELIMVLVLLGILAIFIAPKFSDPSVFTARGFHDETLAILRYAQKTAIAQRRAVCVDFAAAGVSLRMFAANPAPATCAAATAVQAPALALPFTPSGGSGLSVVPAPSPSPMQFTPLGSTDQGAKLTVSIANSTDIFVEATTGYVHD